jgi:hypothetical protein
MTDGVRDYWVHFLRRVPGDLYAVLDAARDPGVRKIGGESLYDGAGAEALEDVAPYLVALDGERLEHVVLAGWGRAWGIFLASKHAAPEIHTHLQRLLEVETEFGEHYYFRFYDPRVLRAFGLVCTPNELDELCGPIDRFVVEARRPTAAWEIARDGVRAIGVVP